MEDIIRKKQNKIKISKGLPNEDGKENSFERKYNKIIMGNSFIETERGIL